MDLEKTGEETPKRKKRLEALKKNATFWFCFFLQRTMSVQQSPSQSCLQPLHEITIININGQSGDKIGCVHILKDFRAKSQEELLLVEDLAFLLNGL